MISKQLVNILTAAFILILISSLSIMSEDSSEIIFESILDESLQESDEDLIQRIEYYRNHKLYLRKALVYQLSDLPYFTNEDAQKIKEYLNRIEYTTFSTLCDSLNFTPSQEIILESCTTLDLSDWQENKLLIDYRSRSLSYLNETYGLSKNKFKGTGLDFNQKILIKKNNYQFGFLHDKDYGEKSIFDFMSTYGQYKNESINLIVGDFVIEYGLGSILGKTFSSGKSSDVISPISYMGNGIKPYQSSIDNNFFRGSAFSFNFKVNQFRINSSAWASKISRSATIDTNIGVATSIYKVGLYRTNTEINKKNNLSETSLGSSLTTNFNKFELGLLAYSLNYKYPITSESSSAFNGKEGLLKNAYLAYLGNDFTVISDLAYDAKNNLAVHFNTLYRYDDLKIAFNYRQIESNYRAPNGSSFGEFSSPSNEEGYYFGIYHQLSNSVSQAFYFDKFRTFTRTYSVGKPINGFDIFADTRFEINSNNELYCRFRYEKKTDSFKDIAPFEKFYDLTKIYLRAEYKRFFNNHHYAKCRIEGSFANYENLKPNQFGLGAYMENYYQLTDKLSCVARLAIFDTDSYDSGIWTYEYAMQGLIKTIALYKEGLRFFFNIEYKFYNYFQLVGRYELNYKPNEKELGSGYLETFGNNDNKIYLQLEFEY